MIFLHNHLHNLPAIKAYRLCFGFGFLVETETQHVALVGVVKIEVFKKLIFAAFVVTVAAPNLHLDDVLSAIIVDNHICARAVAGLCLYVIIACAVDNWADVEHKESASFLLLEIQIFVAVNITKMLGEFFKDFVHFEGFAIDELALFDAALVIKVAVDFFFG